MKRNAIGIAALVLIGGACLYFISTSRIDPMQRFASRLDGVISSERIGRQVIELASKSHRAGTAENRRAGDAIIARLKQFNLQVSTTEYSVPLYEPLKQQLFLTAPESKEFHFGEKPLPADPYSTIAGTEIPFFAYSPDADVEGELIYANFGTREDYDLLKKQGISLTGKIALVRAQGICRSMKTMIAEEQGLAGLLLYPELRDQGMTKAPFPDGPALNPWVAQRGSVLKYFLSPGDPDHTLPTVPALPISAEVAIELFKNLKGPPAVNEWRGSNPIRYSVGPGPARVRIVNQGKTERRTIRNIFAIIQGTNTVEQKVMVSTHYDAWVYGACDPASGTATVLETADALSELRKQGWHPRRTIVFGFWDAEEYGMLGSSSWVRQNLETVRKEVALQFYVDSIRAKNFTTYITPGLRSALEQMLRYVNDPEQDRPLADLHGTFELPGYSDDTAPFTGLLGTPSARVGFGTYYSTYHSLYDDPLWLSKFGDPGFKYEASIAKVLALCVNLFAGNEIFPFHFSEISRSISEKMANDNIHDSGLESELSRYEDAANHLQELLERKKRVPDSKAEQVNRLLQQGLQSFAWFPDSPFEKRNTLIGASQSEGCAGQLAAALYSGSASEVHRLLISLRRSRQFIEEGSRLLASD